MGRAPCCEKVGLKRGRWTAEEDEILIRHIQAHGEGSWRSLPKNAGLLRCGKSCRLRWINYLKAGLKRGNISPEEEEIIIKLHSSYGNRWSLIARHLPGRTDNEIKNYWNSHLSRRIHSFSGISNDGVVPILGGCKRKGTGRTSRAAMKKNKTHLEMRRPEKRQASAGALSTVPVPEKATLKAVPSIDNEMSVVPGEEKVDDVREDEGMAIESWNVGCREESERGALAFNEGLESGFLMYSDEVIGSGVSDLIEERENGVTDLKDERENKERFESDEKGYEWCSSLDNAFEEMGCSHVEWLDWKWEWEDDEVIIRGEDDGGEIWSWMWELSAGNGGV